MDGGIYVNAFRNGAMVPLITLKYGNWSIEGGGRLADCVLRAGIVDYVEFHIAPKLLGGRNSIPVLGGEDPVSLADALELHQIKVRFFGTDIAVSGYTGE